MAVAAAPVLATADAPALARVPSVVTEEAERVVGPSRASADDVASEWDTMALLALLDWVPPLPIPFVVRCLPGAIAKADLNTYDRATSATRLQSCFHRRWRDFTSRRHICTHLYTLQPKKIPSCNRVRTENVMVPKRTIWFQNVRLHRGLGFPRPGRRGLGFPRRHSRHLSLA